MSKILLADDSTHAQRMGTKILSAEGIQVITVSNGEAAAKKVMDGDFDLVLADCFMPGRSGYELCAFIKESPKLRYIPVVLVVGQLEPYDPEQGKNVHADGVLTKPFEASKVMGMVRPLLELAKRRKPAPPPPEEEPEEARQETAPAEFDVSTTSPQAAAIEVPPDMAQAGFDMLVEAGPAVEFSPAPAPVTTEPSGSMFELPIATPEELPAAQAETPSVVPQDTSAFEVERSEVSEESAVPSGALVMEQPAPPAIVFEEPATELILEAQPAVAETTAQSEAKAEAVELELEAEPAAAEAAASPVPAAPDIAALPSSELEFDLSAMETSAEFTLPVEPAAATELVLSEEPAPAEEPAAVAEQATPEEPVAPAVAAEDLKIAGTVAAPLHWVAQAEPVTDADRALFVRAAAQSAVAPTAAAAPDSVPDWAELLQSVEEAPPAAATARLSPLPAAPPSPAFTVQAEPAVPLAPAGGAVDEAVVRSAVEDGLDKAAMPGLKAVPGLVDAITAEVVRRLRSES